MHGYAKQAAGYGYTKVRGLNIQLAAVSTPLAAPVIARARLRKGNTGSAAGAGRMLAQAIATARAAGVKGRILARADSALCRYRHKADYAEVLVMPMSMPEPFVWAVIDPLRSA